MPEVNLKSYAEYLQTIDHFKNDGYQIIPYENIEIGALGFIAAKNSDEISCEWLPHGRLSTNIINSRSEQEFEEFYNIHSKHSRFAFCSFPRELRLGMVCYCQIDKNISNIFKISISTVKMFRCASTGELAKNAVLRPKSYLHMFLEDKYIQLL